MTLRRVGVPAPCPANAVSGFSQNAMPSTLPAVCTVYITSPWQTGHSCWGREKKIKTASKPLHSMRIQPPLEPMSVWQNVHWESVSQASKRTSWRQGSDPSRNETWLGPVISDVFSGEKMLIYCQKALCYRNTANQIFINTFFLKSYDFLFLLWM